MCVDCILNDRSLPILTLVGTKRQLKSRIDDAYVPLRSRVILSINLYITDERRERVSLDFDRVNCTLHLKTNATMKYTSAMVEGKGSAPRSLEPISIVSQIVAFSWTKRRQRHPSSCALISLVVQSVNQAKASIKRVIKDERGKRYGKAKGKNTRKRKTLNLQKLSVLNKAK